MRRSLVTGAIVVVLANGAALSGQDTVRFTPTTAAPTFAVRQPVLRIKPGTVLVSRTNFGPYYTVRAAPSPVR